MGPPAAGFSQEHGATGFYGTTSWAPPDQAIRRGRTGCHIGRFQWSRFKGCCGRDCRGARPAAERDEVNVKTVRRYVAAAEAAALVRDFGEGQLSEELLGTVLGAVRPARPDGHGDSREQLVPQAERIRKWVKDGRRSPRWLSYWRGRAAN